MKRFGLGLLALALLPSCASDQQTPRLDEGVVATFEDGEITLEDFTRELLELPPGRRPTADTLDEGWLEEFVAELVVDRLLDRQAELTGFAGDPRILAARAEFERAEAWNAFVRRNLPRAVPPSESVLRAEFERRLAAAPVRSERRLVGHIFLRRRPDESNEDLRRRASELRSRLQGGERFARLAEEFSDSQTRDRGGSIGWIERSQLEPAVADIVFSLADGSVSEPAVTRDGAHLFNVTGIQQRPDFVFDDLRAELAREMMTAEQQEHVLELARALPEPDGTFFVASEDELLALSRANDPTALVLRSGDYEIRLGALMERASGGAAPATVLDSLALREKVYSEALRGGGQLPPDARRRIERATAVERRRLQRLDGMRLLLGRDEQRLQEYFEANKARFSTPLTVELDRLRVPAEGNEKRLVLALGDRLRESQPEGPDLEALASQFGGEIEALGWTPIDRLLDPGLASAVADLEPGQATLPRFVGGSVEVTRLRGRREPETRGLATVLEEVRDAYLEEFGQPLYVEWREGLLAGSAAAIDAPSPNEVLEALAPPAE